MQGANKRLRRRSKAYAAQAKSFGDLIYQIAEVCNAADDIFQCVVLGVVFQRLCIQPH
jgi:hypothetical protein